MKYYCEDCPWYENTSDCMGKIDIGVCRYNPPVVINTSGNWLSVFPDVRAKDYCRIVINHYKGADNCGQ